MTDKVIDSIANDDAVDVVDQVAQELGQRALDALAQAKLDQARAMFQPEIDVEDAEETETDFVDVEEPETEEAELEDGEVEAEDTEEVEADVEQQEEIADEESDEDTERAD